MARRKVSTRVSGTGAPAAGVRRPRGGGPVTLRQVAAKVGLSSATVSLVLNQAPVSYTHLTLPTILRV